MTLLLLPLDAEEWPSPPTKEPDMTVTADITGHLNNPNRHAFLTAEKLAPEATADELLRCTGFARCTDCGHVMRAHTLTNLPEHYCTRRQALRPAQAALDTP